MQKPRFEVGTTCDLRWLYWKKSCNFFLPHKQLHLHVFWRCLGWALKRLWTSFEDVGKYFSKSLASEAIKIFEFSRQKRKYLNLILYRVSQQVLDRNKKAIKITKGEKNRESLIPLQFDQIFSTQNLKISISQFFFWHFY